MLVWNLAVYARLECFSAVILLVAVRVSPTLTFAGAEKIGLLQRLHALVTPGSL